MVPSLPSIAMTRFSRSSLPPPPPPPCLARASATAVATAASNPAARGWESGGPTPPVPAPDGVLATGRLRYPVPHGLIVPAVVEKERHDYTLDVAASVLHRLVGVVR